MPDSKTRLHPEAIRGLRLLRAGEYFHAHEALENAWRATTGPARGLYQGILQVAVVYHHITRGNLTGAVKVHRRCRRWLDDLPDVYFGVEVGQLRRDLDILMARLEPGDGRQPDPALLKPVGWHEE
jgi:predicted metal-dependent hydrolase